MSREVARLVEKHGGLPRSVPAVREQSALTTENTNDIVDVIFERQRDVVVFMTGVSVSILFEMAEQLGRRPELVSGLRAATTVCRGPKPTAALRGFGVPPTLTAKSSFTSAEVVDVLTGLDVREKRVLLFHYGERSATVAETLRARGAHLDERWLYRWLPPQDSSNLRALANDIVAGDIDALAITCQIQFRHLLKVAEDEGRGSALIAALNRRVVVGAVGPVCRAVLESYGVRVHVMPEHPKMGQLVIALMSRC